MALSSLIKALLVSSGAASSLYDLSATDIDGNVIPLHFKGNVSVVINVATF